jgi:hypothetical protein
MRKVFFLMSFLFGLNLLVNAQELVSYNLTEYGFPIIIQAPKWVSISRDNEAEAVDVAMEDGTFGYFIMEMPALEEGEAGALADVKLNREIISDNSGKEADAIKFIRFIRDDPFGHIYENAYSDGEVYYTFYCLRHINGKNYLFNSVNITETSVEDYIKTYDAVMQTKAAN